MKLQEFNLNEICPFAPSEAAQNPQLVFSAFFKAYSLDESKQMLWNLLKAAMCSLYSDELNDRENFLVFVESLVPLFDAADALHQHNEKPDSIAA